MNLKSFTQPIFDMWHRFSDAFSDIQIHMWLVVTIAVIFIVLHYLRRFPIIRNVSIAFSFIPVLIHELGHAITATLTRSTVSNIHITLTNYGLNKTSSQGFAQTAPRGWLSNILITFMGYVAPPIMFFLGFYFVEHDKSYVYIAILILMGLYYLIKTDQKWIPIIILVILFYSGFQLTSDHLSTSVHVMHWGYSVFLGLLLGEMIQSILITAQLTFKGSDTEWDGSALKDITLIPNFIWWFIWTFISVITVIYTIF